MKYYTNSRAQPWQSPYIGNSSNSGSGNYGWSGNGSSGGPGGWGGNSYYHPYVVSSNWSPPVYPRPNPNVINNTLNRANEGGYQVFSAGTLSEYDRKTDTWQVLFGSGLDVLS